MNPKIIIRNEIDADVDAITEVTVAAFKTLEISNNTEQYFTIFSYCYGIDFAPPVAWILDSCLKSRNRILELFCPTFCCICRSHR